MLSKKGHHLNIMSRRPDYIVPPGIRVIQGDLISALCPLDNFVEHSEIIFHCAGETRCEEKMRSLHVDATQRLLEATLNEASKRERPIHWVQLSSVSVYGPPGGMFDTDRVVTEATQANPIGEYGITKTISDELVIQACQDHSMTYTIVRPSNVFGKDMTNMTLRSLGAMIQKRLFFYIGRPGAVATYVHVDDVVELLLRCGFEQRARGKIFNLSNDCMLEELVNSISIALDTRRPRLRLPEPLVRFAAMAAAKIATIPLTQERIDVLVSRTRYPYHKLEQELGYAPEKSVLDTIDEVL